MRLAMAGKGGVGKTSISGTLARALARSGQRVLAIDADANPNLGLTLGIPPAEFNSLPTLPRTLVHGDGTEAGVVLNTSLEDICAAYSVRAGDDVTLLVMANPQHAGAG